MGRSWRVRVSGPLEPYAVGFREELQRWGYSPWTMIAALALMDRLSNWLAAHRLEPGGLSTADVQRFVRDQRGNDRVRWRSPKGLLPLVGYLRGVGVVAPASARCAVDGPWAAVVAEFVDYLAGERGLAGGTIYYYRKVAARFLSAYALQGDAVGMALKVLTAGEVSSFVVSECGRRSVGSVKNVVTALRALLRFLHVRGYLCSPLVDAVPAAAGWCRHTPVQLLRVSDVAGLLGSCDRCTTAGRRDYAILVLLARLGLRAGEVAALTVDDVDWRAGEIVISGKGNRRERLPLPVDVGQALADYCRWGRSQARCRRVFVHSRAPYTALSGSAVGKVVERACDRVGLPRMGAHRLRHAAVTALRRGGAPLGEIGQVLRHSHPATTARYGTIDVDELVAVVRPWPDGAR